MATREDARGAIQAKLGELEPKRLYRTIYLGDGRGAATSNMWVPHQEQYVYARESPDSTRFFMIRNATVQPKFNLPVIAGYLAHNPDLEQVLGVDHDATAYVAGGGAGSFTGLGPHGDQHEFGGGDETYIDPRLFLEGLVKPTSPPSASIRVDSFSYFYDQWDRYPGSINPALSNYLPSGPDTRYVLVALDPESRKIVYRPGNIISGSVTSVEAAVGGGIGTVTWDGWEGFVPQPAGDEYPLGAIRLTASTTNIDWFDSTGSAVILSTRLFIQPPWKRVLDRITGLENLTGVGKEQSLPATGAQQESSDKFRTNAALLQDVSITEVAPTDGQVLGYSAAKNAWTPQAAGGAANTHASATNLGDGGYGLFKETYAGLHQFKTILAGTNISLASAASTVTITGQAATSGQSLGSGQHIFKEIAPTGTVQIKSLSGMSGIAIASQNSSQLSVQTARINGYVIRQTDTSVATGAAGYDVKWESEVQDTDGLIATADAASITIRTAGVYIVRAQNIWANAGDSTRRSIIILYDSSEQAENSIPAISGAITVHEVTDMRYLDVNTGIGIKIGQFSAGTINSLQVKTQVARIG